MPRYFTQDHEWIDVDGDTGTVGITDFAQGQLGDITFVELPEPGTTVKQGDAPCVVDSVKAASDVYAPVGGTVTEANAALADETTKAGVPSLLPDQTWLPDDEFVSAPMGRRKAWHQCGAGFAGHSLR